MAQAEGDKVYRPRLGRPDDWDKEAYLADGSDDRWVVRVQSREVARFVDCTYNPSGSWWQGGPIIEREKISTEEIQGAWKAELEILTADDAHYRYGLGYGPTPLIAAMRCYVAANLGAEVEIPEELA